MARLAAYQKEFGADWDLWTGTPAQIAAFWKPFGVEYQKIPEEQPPKDDWWTGQPLTYDVEHTDGYVLIDPSGRERFVDATAPNMKGQLDPKLTALLDEGGVHELDNPEGPNWTTADALASISWLLGANVPAQDREAGQDCAARPSSSRQPSPAWHCSSACAATRASRRCRPRRPPTCRSPSPCSTPRQGPILATGGGNTLYDFVPDTPTHSACLNDDCVFQWPPLLESGPVTVGKGVDASLVGTLHRPGGSTQLSYGGHPLYTYNLDVTPGMVTGQAVDQDGGLWYVLNAKGQQVTTSFSVTTPNANG